MSAPLGLLLANAVGAGLIALAAWLLSRRVRSQTLVHGLWVLALVRLLSPPLVPLPLLPEWSFPQMDLSRGPAVVVIEAAPSRDLHLSKAGAAASMAAPPSATDLLLARDDLAVPAFDTVAAPSPTSPSAVGLPPVPGSANGRWHPLDLLPLAWLVLLGGAVVVSALAGLRIRRFVRLLRLASPAPAALSTRTAELATRLGLRRTPPVLLLPARVPPMLWPGRGGPSLLMPLDLLPQLTDEERDTLLLHELAHVRRRDHWVRFLELAVTTVFWWYPVTWWVRRALRRAEERCCDEWVLRLMPASAPAYAEGLLKSLDFVSGESDPLPVGASGAGPVRDLESRLKEILMMTPTPRLTTPARLALALAAVLGLSVFPTRAQSPSPAVVPDDTPTADVELPPAPPAPEVAVTADPAPPAPEVASPALPAPPADVRPPAPALPAPPGEPALAPAPESPLPAPPAPAMAAPAPDPHPAPRPTPVVSPAPAPIPRVVAEPRPVVAPAPVVLPQDPEHEAALQEIEEEHLRLVEERAALHQKELALVQERMAKESAARQEHFETEAERLRAQGKAEEAQRVEQHARALAERMALQRRELEQEQARLEEQRQRDSAIQAKARELRQLEQEGRQDQARALQAEIATLEQDLVRGELAHQRQQFELQRETVEAEHRARLAELELQREHMGEARNTRRDLEREQARVTAEMELERRELEAMEAEQKIHAKEVELRELESAGRAEEAEAAREEIESLRQDIDAARLDLQQERLLRATSELKLQVESQLAALRHLQSRGSSDADVDREIERLQAALDALQ